MSLKRCDEKEKIPPIDFNQLKKRENIDDK